MSRSAMKEFIFFARACRWLMVALPLAASAQETDIDAHPNYVVIGAFAHHGNAVNFTEDANKNNFGARFEMNPNRNLYYVYVLATQDRELAITEAAKLRADTKYFDTWVYSGLLGEGAIAEDGRGAAEDLDPVTGQRLVSVATEQDAVAEGSNELYSPVTGDLPPAKEGVRQERKSTHARRENPVTVSSQNPSHNQEAVSGSGSEVALQPQTKDVHAGAGDVSNVHPTALQQRSLVQSDKQNTPFTTSVTGPGVTSSNPNVGDVEEHEGQERGAGGTPASQLSASDEEQALATDATGERVASREKIPAPVRATTEPLQAEDVIGKDFYFHLLRADNARTISGEVDAIDFERSRRMATYPANEAVTVRLPSTDSKHISFVCQVFGYRKLQKEFEPNRPSEDLYLDDKGNLVVPFELVRLQKGDIAIMYNVFFFQDAAVMRPESRYEVNNLVELLEENPTYNIVIHGHTNGNASGKIIRMDEPGNFYSLSGTKQGMGSAKKLSEERAMVIREYLTSSGIQEARMAVKAWGGKKPIHDKHSVRANENVRVEIEILSE